MTQQLLRYWVRGSKSDECILQEVGVILGSYSEENEEWEGCFVSDEILKLLEPHWLNKFIWGPMAEEESNSKKKRKIDYSEYSTNLSIQRIETGIMPLDVVLGGGYTPGDLIEISSESGLGKSTTCLHWASRELTRKGRKIAYLDVERGVKSGLLEAFGLLSKITADPEQEGDKFLLLQPNTFTDADDILMDLIQNKGYNLIFIDSVTALMPTRLLEKGIEEAEIGLKARIESNFLNKLKGVLRTSSATVVSISQMRTKMETVGRSMNVTQDSAGGNAAKFYPDIRIRMDKGPDIFDERSTIFDTEQKIKVGNEARIYSVKNRSNNSFIKVPMPILFGKGVSNILFAKQVMSRYDLYTCGGGGFFKFSPDMHIMEGESIRGTDAFEAAIKANLPAIREYLKSKGYLNLLSAAAQ